MIMPTSLTANTIAGVGIGSLSMTLFGDVFPDTVMQSAVYGGLGGMGRWLAARRINTKDVLSIVPLAIILAIGLDELGGPIIQWYLDVDDDEHRNFLRVVLSQEDSRRGISFLTGLFGAMVLGFVFDKIGGRDEDSGTP